MPANFIEVFAPGSITSKPQDFISANQRSLCLWRAYFCASAFSKAAFFCIDPLDEPTQ